MRDSSYQILKPIETIARLGTLPPPSPVKKDCDYPVVEEKLSALAQISVAGPRH